MFSSLKNIFGRNDAAEDKPDTTSAPPPTPTPTADLPRFTTLVKQIADHIIPDYYHSKLHDNPDAMRIVQEMVDNYSDEATAHYRQQLAAGDVRERAIAMRVLAIVSGTDAIPWIEAALHKSYWLEEIVPGVHILAHFYQEGERDVRSKLETLAHHQDVDIRKTVRQTLSDLGIEIDDAPPDKHDTPTYTTRVKEADKLRKRVTIPPLEHIVDQLTSASFQTRQRGLEQLMRLGSPQSLSSIEAAICRLANVEQPLFYRVGGFTYGAMSQAENAVERLAELAAAGQLLDDIPYTQLLITKVGRQPGANEALMQRMQQGDHMQLTCYQFLGIQMQLAIQFGDQ